MADSIDGFWTQVPRICTQYSFFYVALHPQMTESYILCGPTLFPFFCSQSWFIYPIADYFALLGLPTSKHRSIFTLLTKVNSEQNLVTGLFTLCNVYQIPCYAPPFTVTLGIWCYFPSVETKAEAQMCNILQFWSPSLATIVRVEMLGFELWVFCLQSLLLLTGQITPSLHQSQTAFCILIKYWGIKDKKLPASVPSSHKWTF